MIRDDLICGFRRIVAPTSLSHFAWVRLNMWQELVSGNLQRRSSQLRTFPSPQHEDISLL